MTDDNNEDDRGTLPATDDATATRQVAIPEIGDGSGAVVGDETARGSAVPLSVASVRATVPTAPHTATVIQSAASVADLADLDELDFGDLEEATDPDAGPPLFAQDMQPGAAPIAAEPPPTPDVANVAAETAAAETAPAETAPAEAVTADRAPPDEASGRRGKAQRRSKKRARSAEKSRARETTRAAGSGPLAEELPDDAIEMVDLFGAPPALPEMGLIDLPMPSSRRRSRQDMHNMLQEFSVMFRLDTKVRKRRSGWVIALAVLAVAGAVAFLATRDAPVDAADDVAIRVVLAQAQVVHATGTVYLIDSPAALAPGVTETAEPPRRAHVSILALKLAQLTHLRTLKRGKLGQ